MSAVLGPRWGDRIVVNEIAGVPLRMYAERPRRIPCVLDLAVGWGDRPHILQDDRVVTFAAMLASVRYKAGTLAHLGIKRGDRVGIAGWNSPEWITNFWACLKLGAVPVLTNAWWSPAEFAHGLDRLQPALVLADDRALGKMPAGVRLGPWATTAGLGAAAESGANDIARAAADDVDGEMAGGAIDAGKIDGGKIDGGEVGGGAIEAGDEEDAALIIFTSGTAGAPKAVLLSHRAVLARLQMTLHVTRKLPHQLDAAGWDITLITGPLFHVGGMQTLLRAAVVGDSLVLPHGRFDPGEVLTLIERHRINRWNAVPTMVSRLLDHPDVPHRDLRSLRSISIGGAPVHAELMRRIRAQLPDVSPRIPTGYGLTENGGQATAAAGSDGNELLGSSGKPLPCVEVKIVARDALPDGEILLRSPTQMSGYLGEADSPIDRDGWLHTGDLGRLDDAGHLWITGRCKELIIRGGENVAPIAVERALLAIPGINEAAVFGIPHADLGEEVAAVVVVNGPHTAEAIQAHLRTSLATFAVPSRWRLQREPLPVNQAGKVDKPALRASLISG